MQVKILAWVCLYCILIFSLFSFVTLKISIVYGLGLILVFILILLFFTIPAYKTRMDLSSKFCTDIIQSASSISDILMTISESNGNSEILINIYSFNSKFRLAINATPPLPKKIEDECNAVSNKLSEILNEYDAKQNGRIYVNFDALSVGITALLLLDNPSHIERASLRLAVRGYSEHFSFIGEEKKSIIREINNSIINPSL